MLLTDLVDQMSFRFLKDVVVCLEGCRVLRRSGTYVVVAIAHFLDAGHHADNVVEIVLTNSRPSCGTRTMLSL